MVENAKFRVYNVEHAMQVVDRLCSINLLNRYLHLGITLERTPVAIYITGGNRIFAPRSFSERSFEDMPGKEMTLSEIHAIAAIEKYRPSSNVEVIINHDRQTVFFEKGHVGRRTMSKILEKMKEWEKK